MVKRIVSSGDGMPKGAISVLDKGFVRVTDTLGSDITPVNAARISFGKEVSEFSPEKDGKLLDYLASHKHTSPFRHAMIQFHIKAPEVVMRQWWKHIVGCNWTAEDGSFNDTGWNEISGRYVEFTPEFYVPESFRPQSQSNKQASDDGDLSNKVIGAKGFFSTHTVRNEYLEAIDDAYKSYDRLIKAGVSKEQARMVLPISLYVECYWTASLQAVAHFCKLRVHKGAQGEIQEYANAVNDLASQAFPHAFEKLL
jgi:thymidylate synthase (FAD)